MLVFPILCVMALTLLIAAVSPRVPPALVRVLAGVIAAADLAAAIFCPFGL